MDELEAAERVVRLSALASAIAGEPLQVVCAPAGHASSTDGVILQLDLRLSNDALRDACVAQALLVAAGSLRVKGALRLVGRAEAAQRYFALELMRAARLHAERVPHRFERALAALSLASTTRDEEDSLACALDMRRSVPRLPAHFGVLRPARLVAARVRSRGDQRAMRRGAVEQHSEDDELDDSADRLLKLFSTPLSGSALSDWVAKLLGLGRSPAGSGQSASDDGAAVALAGSELSAGAPSADAQRVATGVALKAVRTMRPTRFVYPEWSSFENRYRARWTHVHERRPPSAAPAVREPSEISAHAVRAQIARIGLQLERHRAQPDGEELDLDRLVESVVDRGSEQAPRIYRAARRTRRDLALLVLLDVSQSTAERNASGRSIFTQQREVAREIVRASERLGDRVALMAFHSWGRHVVQLERVKGFEQRFDRRAHGRLDALEPSGLTRMGAAIRHGTHTLEREQKRSHRVMLLLTDGFAYDDGYTRSYAEVDTARALEEAAAEGIGCVCLNIGSTQDDEVLKRLYGPASYLRCADPARAVPKLRSLMRGAMARSA